MSVRLDPNSRLAELLSAACSDMLTDSEREELDSLLLDNAAAQRDYLAYCRMHTDLLFHNRSHAAVQAAFEVIRAEAAEQSAFSGQRSAISGQQSADKATSHSSLITHHSSLRSWDRYLWRHRVGVGVAAGMVFVVAVLSWAAVTYLPGLARVEQVKEDVVYIAKLANWHEPEWLDDTRPLLADPRLKPGTRLALKSGLIEIKYNTGAKVMIEGPAEFTVGKSGNEKAESGENIHHSSLITHRFNSGYLALGKLVARVEGKVAEGFTVETPTARVEDLGTEFAIAVNENGRSDVHVWQGSVRLDAQAASATTASLVLKTNETARVDRDTQGVVPLDRPQASSGFVRYHKLAERVAEEYAERVLALQPAAYWRMEGREQLHVADSGPAQHHGTARTSAAHAGDFSPWTYGTIGSALRLRGPAAGDCVVVDDYPESTTGQLTVAAWVQAESRPPWAMIAANWGHDRKTGQFHFGFMANDGDLCAQITQADGTWLHAREGVGSPFVLGRWQHVAFVADGKLIRLYRDGSEVASAAYDGTLLATPPPGMAIGCKLDDNGVKPVGMNWHGSIDELILLHRALTADEIRQLVSRYQSD